MNTQALSPKRKDARQEVDRFAALANKVLELIKNRNVNEPRTGPTFSISDTAKLVGRSTSAIRMAEGEGRLPPQERNEQGRRKGYTLADLDKMREVFETRPWREPSDPACIIAVQNFKGGVGKSTVSVHLAQYLAIHGYRVLMIDADAQASASMMFGLIPDQDLSEDDSLISVFRGERTISQVLRKTHYHNLDLIPANLFLYNAEYELAAELAGKSTSLTLLTLASEINKISQNYDVVIMDPPPALGMVSLSVLCAANALVIPMPPSIIDFASTTTFLTMLKTTLNSLADANIIPSYDFINMVISKHGSRDNSTAEVLELTRDIFGRNVIETTMKQSAEITHATARLMSVYDLPAPVTNYEVHRRCLQQLNDVGREIEKLIRSTWPSKAVEG